MPPSHPLNYNRPKTATVKGTVSSLYRPHPEDVLEWRKTRFLQFGYAPYVADFLAESRIDLHAMEDLLANDCPLELATEILMGTTWFGEDPHWGLQEVPDEPEPDQDEVEFESIRAATEA